ncbi:hypothetical protein IPN35_03865 [Candidatus Peregrinibacteria bacterium]|nr:MAG: hypothetical protein IPN35_03865 [Candidatus Peregrinibacteria bacterium]
MPSHSPKNVKKKSPPKSQKERNGEKSPQNSNEKKEGVTPKALQVLSSFFQKGKIFFKEKFLLFRKNVPRVQEALIRGVPFLGKCSIKAITMSFEILAFFITITIIWRFHAPLLLSSLNLYDEGVSLMGAKRLSMGELPYRDFFTIYMPLKFTLLGGVFYLFGTNIFVARVFFHVISLFGFSAIYLLLRRSSNIFFAVLGTLFLSLFGELSLTPFFLVLLAWWIREMTQKPTARFLPFFGGILLGLLLLLRIDFGGMMSISVFFLLSTFFLLSRKQGTSSPLFLSLIGKIGIGLFGILFPVGIAFWKLQLFSEFWSQAISFPLFGKYQELRHLPWPTPSSLAEPLSSFTINILSLSQTFAWFFWMIPFITATGYWVYRGSQKGFPKSAFVTNMFLGFSTLGAFFYASHRSDFGHVLFLNVLGALFLIHLCTTFRQKRDTLFVLPFLVLLALSPAIDILKNRSDILVSGKKEYTFFPVAFPVSPQNDNLQKTLDFFENVPKEEKVYVGVRDTSRVFVNNVVLPFLLKQPVATKYHELHTGIVTTLPIQREMIQELNDVNFVVLWEQFICEPNLGCVSTNVHVLDEYIQKNFSRVQKFGEYEILKRKEA